MSRSISDLRKSFNAAGTATIADYAALIGAKEPRVRVNGLGVRGLRWTVEKVDEKTGLVSIACKNPASGNKEADVVDFRDLTIVTTDKPNSRLSGRF